MIEKAIIVWLIIAIAETIQGIIRIKFISRRIGERNARKLGVVTGTFIILSIGWLTIPWINPTNINDCLLIGLIWLILMLIFDIGLGKYIFHYSWKRIGDDFNLSKGNFLTIGMIVLFLTPLIIAFIRNLL